MRKPFEVWELEVHKLLLSEDAIACTVGEPTKVLRAWHGYGASPQRVALKLNGRYVAALRAQLADAEQRIAELKVWQPAAPGKYKFDGDELHILHGGGLLIASGLGNVHGEREVASAHLPDDWAVCRRR